MSPVAQHVFEVGDIIKISLRSGKDNKVQKAPFEGIVISKKGDGTNKTFTVRKNGADNVAIERIFPLNSPYIELVKVVKKTKVRRAKLYYLRNKMSKK